MKDFCVGRNFTFRKKNVIAGIAIAIVILITILAYRTVTERNYFIFFDMSEAVKRVTVKTAVGEYTFPGWAPGHTVGGEFIFLRAEWNNNILMTGENENGEAVIAEFVINDLSLAGGEQRKKQVAILNQITSAVAGTLTIERVSHINRHHAIRRE